MTVTSNFRPFADDDVRANDRSLSDVNVICNDRIGTNLHIACNARRRCYDGGIVDVGKNLAAACHLFQLLHPRIFMIGQTYSAFL